MAFKFTYEGEQADRFGRRMAKSSAIAVAIKSKIADYLAKIDKTDSRSAAKRVKIDISQERIIVSILDVAEEGPMIKSVTAEDLMGSRSLEEYAFKYRDVGLSSNKMREDLSGIITSVVKELAPRGNA